MFDSGALFVKTSCSVNRGVSRIWPLALLLSASTLFTPVAQAVEHTYTFTGLATVGAVDGGPPVHKFNGTLIYSDDAPTTTTFNANSLYEGFTTKTAMGSVSYLGIELDNGETVTASNGWIEVDNILQAESGSPRAVDLSMQVWMANTSGSINGYGVFNMYLSFLSVAPNFSWDALDNYLGGNSEQLIRANPRLIPVDIDPLMTGTALPAKLTDTFNRGVFLGTNHDLTNTVNSIYTMTEAASAVPEPQTWSMLLAGGLVIWGARRYRMQLPSKLVC